MPVQIKTNDSKQGRSQKQPSLLLVVEAEIYSYIFIALGVLVAITASTLDIRRLFLQRRAATDVVMGIGCQRQLLSKSEREIEGEMVQILTRPRHVGFCIPVGSKKGLVSQKGKYLVYPQEEEFASFIKPGLVNRYWSREWLEANILSKRLSPKLLHV